MTERISKGERDELRRIVRGDFKALGMELEARRAEVIADIEQRVAQRFEPSDVLLADAETRITEILVRGNAEIAAVVDDVRKGCDGYTVTIERAYFGGLRVVKEQRQEMRKALIAELDAEIMRAKTMMARQENDLLRTLASDAIESAKAQAFLASIPKVAELVPMARMAELEAQFSANAATGTDQ